MAKIITFSPTPSGGVAVLTIKPMIAEYHQLLLDAGLVQTTDTGQLNVAGMVEPTHPNPSFALFGYTVYRFNDSLQGTAPIFIRVEHRNGVTASYDNYCPRIQVGSGTDGAGNITGGMPLARLTSAATNSSSVIPSFAANTYSWSYHGEGCAWICYKAGARGSSYPAVSAWMVARTIDASGNLSGAGFVVYVSAANQSDGGGSLRCGSHTFATGYHGAANYDAFNACLITYGIANASAGLNAQTYKHFAPFPDVRVVPQILTYDANLATVGVPVSLDTLGLGARTYMPLPATGSFGPVSAQTAHGAGASANHSVMLQWD